MSIIAKKTGIVLFLLFITAFTFLFYSKVAQRSSHQEPQIAIPGFTPSPSPTPVIIIPGSFYEISHRLQSYQTWNNCGPAALSMLFSYYDINVSQKTLGEKLRPFQNPQGIDDDKSVLFPELAVEAQNYGLVAYNRPGGDLNLLKTLIANDIPVLVTTWLHPGEDIGHYRLIRGFDDSTGEIIQDDSYQGSHLRFSYQEFLEMWQPLTINI